MIPYRDFFDHHGFLIYYFLSPFAHPPSLVLLQYFYSFVQLGCVVLLLLILRRINKRAEFILGGVLYVLTSYYLMGNTTWYDTYVAFFALLIFYLTFFEGIKWRNIAIGILLACIMLIKPPAVLLIIPVLLYRRSWHIIASFVVILTLVTVFFVYQGAFMQMWDQLFVFNWYYARLAHGNERNLIDMRLFMLGGGLIIVPLVLLLYRRINIKQEGVYALLFALTLSLPLFSNITTVGLIPVMPFLIIYFFFLSSSLSNIFRYIWLTLLLVFTLLVGIHAKNEYINNVRNGRYAENKNTIQMVRNIHNLKLPKGSVYVLSNNPEVYYLLNSLPPVHFPFIFPWIDRYYNISLQTERDLLKNNTQYIYVPIMSIKIGSVVGSGELRRWIAVHYHVAKTTNEYVLYERNKK